MPHRFVREHVEVAVGDAIVGVFHGTTVLAEHERARAPHATVVDSSHFDGLWRSPCVVQQDEAGWKDTVLVPPGEVTRILVRWAPERGGAFPFDAASGPGYVWH